MEFRSMTWTGNKADFPSVVEMLGSENIIGISREDGKNVLMIGRDDVLINIFPGEDFGKLHGFAVAGRASFRLQ